MKITKKQIPFLSLLDDVLEELENLHPLLKEEIVLTYGKVIQEWIKEYGEEVQLPEKEESNGN